MPICTSSFLSLPVSSRGGYSDWHCLHPVQQSWLNDRIVCGGTLLSYRMPDIFLQLSHPHRFLLFISVVMSPSLCRVLSRYLNSLTCGSWADCILMLPNGVPFRHIYSVFALDTFIPLFSKASLYCSSSNSSIYGGTEALVCVLCPVRSMSGSCMMTAR